MGPKTSVVSFCCRWRRYSPCLCPTCVIPRTVATRTSAQGRSTDTPFRCFEMGSIAFGAWQQWLWTTPWNLSSLSCPYSNTVMISNAFVMTALTLNLCRTFDRVFFHSALRNYGCRLSQAEVLWVQWSNQWFPVSLCHIIYAKSFVWKII